MTLTLDKTRSFGTIHGENEHGAHFDQDGFLFDATGALIEDAMDSVQRERLKQYLAREEAISRAKAAFKEVMPDAPDEMVDRLITAENLEKAAQPGEIDLVAWGRMEKRYPFHEVTKAIRERFNQSPVNKAQALEILAEHGLIPPLGGTPTIPSQT